MKKPTILRVMVSYSKRAIHVVSRVFRAVFAVREQPGRRIWNNLKCGCPVLYKYPGLQENVILRTYIPNGIEMHG